MRKMYKLMGEGTHRIHHWHWRRGEGHDAYEKQPSFRFTARRMMYEGPGVASRIRKELAELMVDNGHRCVEDVVGLDHEIIYWEKRLERTRVMEKANMIVDM